MSYEFMETINQHIERREALALECRRQRRVRSQAVLICAGILSFLTVLLFVADAM